MKLRKLNEAAFTSMVVKYARLRGWRVAHFRPGLSRLGKWSTPVQGDGAGFPDLLMIRAPKIIVAELKMPGRKPTIEQERWLCAFLLTNVRAFVWTPDSWGEIETVLT